MTAAGASWRAVPEWDVLILPAAPDAEQAATEIARAHGRDDQDGIFARVVERAGSGDRARTAEAAPTRAWTARVAESG